MVLVDGWIKCWDVRKVQRIGGIGVYISVVLDVRWFKGMDEFVDGKLLGEDDKGNQLLKKFGMFLVLFGFDYKVNIFLVDDWVFVQLLSGYIGLVVSVDVSWDGKWIISGGYDWIVKLWGCNDVIGLYGDFQGLFFCKLERGGIGLELMGMLNVQQLVVN